MHSNYKAPSSNKSHNKFSLEALPYYRNTPRPLKSIEVAMESSPLTFQNAKPDETYTKDQFLIRAQNFLSVNGITDDTGNVISSLLKHSEYEGVYRAPDPHYLEGIKIGWFSKPNAPLVSAAFEQSQIDFQSEIMRMIRESEERTNRMVQMMKQAAPSSSTAMILTIPKSEQYANIKKRDFTIMLWTICFCFNMGMIHEIIASPGWNIAIKFWIKKGWVKWSEDIARIHGTGRASADRVAQSTRKNFTSTPPFKDGTLLCPPVTSTYFYSNNEEFEKDIVSVTTLLKTQLNN